MSNETEIKGVSPENNEKSSPSQKKNKKRGRKILLLILLALLLLLLFKSCTSPPFDYFYEKASSLNFDPIEILKFVREEMPTSSYRGNVKGPLGALWHGSASPEEKLALAKALLKYVQKPPKIDLDLVAPQRDKTTDTNKTYFLTITHRLVTKDSSYETKVFSGPIYHLIGEVHSIEINAKTRIFLRGSAKQTKEISRKKINIIAEEICFQIEDPNNLEKPIQLVRELWKTQAKSERMKSPQQGTRHDFVVIPSRITREIRKKEEFLLTQRKRKKGLDTEAYLKLLDYLQGADTILEKIEKEFEVIAEFQLPRILLLSRYQKEKETALALDLRQNYTAFSGEKTNRYQAVVVRSFTELASEHYFLTGRTTLPCFTTFDLLNQLKEKTPNSYEKRKNAIHHALWLLEKRGTIKAQRSSPTASSNALPSKVNFKASSSFRKLKNKPFVLVTLTKEKQFHLASSVINTSFLKEKFQDKKFKLHFNGQKLAAVLKMKEAIEVIETTLRASTPLLAPNYLLETEIALGKETIVVPGSHFEFSWKNRRQRTIKQKITISKRETGLTYNWKIKNGMRAAYGKREISKEALKNAFIHNPWYSLFKKVTLQKEATSFCVSQAVYQSLIKGKKSKFSLQQEITNSDDFEKSRPIEHQGELFLKATKFHRVLINKKEIEIPVLSCEFKAPSLKTPLLISVLADPINPVGKLEHLTWVDTEIRGRLIDENNLGIANAELEIEFFPTITKKDDKGFGDAIDALSTPEKIKTWPDGSFRLPPLTKEKYKKVLLKVTQGTLNDSEIHQKEIDLSSPGLEEILVQVPRRVRKLLWISPKEIKKLKLLPLSKQVKEQAIKSLEKGNFVLIPNAMLSIGASQIIGFLSYNATTGEIIGVTEDGLYGGFSIYGKIPPEEKSNSLLAQKEDFLEMMSKDIIQWEAMKQLLDCFQLPAEKQQWTLEELLLQKTKVKNSFLFKLSFKTVITFLTEHLQEKLPKKEFKFPF